MVINLVEQQKKQKYYAFASRTLLLKENIRYRVYYLRAGPRKNLPMYPQVVAGMAFSETCFLLLRMRLDNMRA